MGVHLPLAIQCIMLPLTAAEDALLSKRLLGPLLGWPTPARAYGELREDPMLRPAVAAAAAVADGPAQVLAPAATVGDVESEEAVLSAWESREPLDVGIFEHLRGQGKDVNYRTADGGWSALMVISGSVAHEGRDVSRLLEMGADPALTDAEGWTALHWAAHHGIPAAISAIAATHGVPASSSPAPGLKRALMRGSVADLLALLNAEDVKGKTPLQVAREASNSKTVDNLEALQSLCRESSLLGRNEERANDAHTPTPVSPEAVSSSLAPEQTEPSARGSDEQIDTTPSGDAQSALVSGSSLAPEQIEPSARGSDEQIDTTPSGDALVRDIPSATTQVRRRNKKD
jgi:hypothetical protein